MPAKTERLDPVSTSFCNLILCSLTNWWRRTYATSLDHCLFISAMYVGSGFIKLGLLRVTLYCCIRVKKKTCVKRIDSNISSTCVKLIILRVLNHGL